MANNSTLKSSIRSVVKTNGQGDITGQNMQNVLLSMVDVLGAGYMFLGGCTPSTNPGTPDNNVFYLATEAGTYSNFTGDAITEPTIFYYDTAWHALPVNGNFSTVLRVADIVNNLSSTSTTKPLSAAQGHALNQLINTLSGEIQQMASEGFVFMGIAHPVMAAPQIDPDLNLVYIAEQTTGTFSIDPTITFEKGELALIYRDQNSWHKEVVGTYLIADDVVNNLSSDETAKPLSAKQGKALASDVSTLEGRVDNLDDSKADKVASATNGNFAGLDGNGNLTDSGKKAADFATAEQGGKADTAVQPSVLEETLENYAQKDGYYAGMAVGLADNLRGNVYADEQFAVRMTGGEANEVGGIGVVQVLKGAGAAIVQMFPEGANHDFSGDVSLDGTGGNAEAPLRYSNYAGTVEMGYLLCLEAFVSQTLTQAQLDAIAAKDTGKADRDKAVWLTPAGAITSAPTIESGQTEVTFSGWRIAMRVKASEVRDASASGYWFTSGTAGRQVFDVAVAEGIDLTHYYWGYGEPYFLANGWDTKSAMEYLNHMAAQGLPTHQTKSMSALLAVTKIGIKTVKSKNLLNPQTGRALLKAYVNDDENFLDNEYTMLGGLPSGSTMAFTSLLTGKTETLTMLDSTHFVIPSDGWLQITGTLPTSIIATWDGTKDNTAADEYATESYVWDVTQLFGTKDGGTEGHYYRFAKEGMRGAGSACDVVELVGARGSVVMKNIDLGSITSWSVDSGAGRVGVYFTTQITDANAPSADRIANILLAKYTRATVQIVDTKLHDKTFGMKISGSSIQTFVQNYSFDGYSATQVKNALTGIALWYPLATPITFTSLFLSASSTADELTAMPADAIPLSEIQFADNNWSIEEAIYDAPEADANGVITPTAVTGQMRIQYSLDAAEQIDTLQKEYQALEARVTALENA